MFKTVGPPVPLTEMNAVTKGDGLRLYEVGDGKWYPSVTTVTSHRKKDSIIKWRKRVGEAEANKISGRASARGNKFHSMVESYLKNETVSFDDKSPLASFLFKTAKETLHRIDNIHLLESPLYSDSLRIAGRVDCIAEYDGELAVIDFKTSTKEKKESWIENYFVQETAYAAMYYERSGVKVDKIVTLIATEEGGMQIFEKYDLDYYYVLLEEYIQEFMQSIK
jgi:genome maintenance exonuclease 1|tara:strand:+ start:10851 stop:11519 length:669 start_codon:yes stop_codon:yes gene_type:complete